MDKPISVGDLVVRVRSCCGVHVGTIRRIEGFSEPTECQCITCGSKNGVMVKAYFEGDATPSACPLPWLKRIPPLEELDDVRTEDEVTA
jgi:hypothetical protein